MTPAASPYGRGTPPARAPCVRATDAGKASPRPPRGGPEGRGPDSGRRGAGLTRSRSTGDRGRATCWPPRRGLRRRARRCVPSGEQRVARSAPSAGDIAAAGVELRRSLHSMACRIVNTSEAPGKRPAPKSPFTRPNACVTGANQLNPALPSACPRGRRSPPSGAGVAGTPPLPERSTASTSHRRGASGRPPR
jgi:hypothetical protein